jgi:hypothetical protein
MTRFGSFGVSYREVTAMSASSCGELETGAPLKFGGDVAFAI